MVCSGVARRDVAPAVDDAVDVHVDGDRRAAEPDGERQGGDLGPDAAERGQSLHRVGNMPAVLVDDPPREVEDVARLRLGEAGPRSRRDRAAPPPAPPSVRASSPRRRAGGRPPASSRPASGPRSGCRPAARTASRSPGRAGRTSPPWASPPPPRAAGGRPRRCRTALGSSWALGNRGFPLNVQGPSLDRPPSVSSTPPPPSA